MSCAVGARRASRTQFLIGGYNAVGGVIFLVGLALSLLGMVLSAAPEFIRREATALRASRVAVRLIILGIVVMAVAIAVG
ncbi:MAG TPA: hypothetical protein VJ957_06530 [Longimicrobiales bacterium]|nr:hypothetical protein [Longimicrobiales bacterium]